MKSFKMTLILCSVVFISFLAASCTPQVLPPDFGAPGVGPQLSGVAVLPGSCFPADECENPRIPAGSFPLAEGIALLYGAESGTLQVIDETDCGGNIATSGTGEESYLMYVVREIPAGSNRWVVLKKALVAGVTDFTDFEVNTYTTAQVMIWEEVNKETLNTGFAPFAAEHHNRVNWLWVFNPVRLAMPVSEIPDIIPNEDFLLEVENALLACIDPQCLCEVQDIALVGQP